MSIIQPDCELEGHGDFLSHHRALFCLFFQSNQFHTETESLVYTMLPSPGMKGNHFQMEHRLENVFPLTITGFKT